MTDPYTAQGVARMFPGTLGGRTQLATPAHPITRRPARKPGTCPRFVGTISPASVGGTTNRWSQVFDSRGGSIWLIGDNGASSFVEEWSYPGLTLLGTTTLADGIGTAADFFGGDGTGGVVYMDGNSDIARWNGGHTVLDSPFEVEAYFDPVTQRIINIYRTSGGAGPWTVKIDAITMAGVVTNLATFTSSRSPRSRYPTVTPDGAVWWAEGSGAGGPFIARWTPGGGYQSSTVPVHSNLFARPDNTVWMKEDLSPSVFDVHTNLASNEVGCPDLSSIVVGPDITPIEQTPGAGLLVWAVRRLSGGVYSFDVYSL